MPKCGSANQEGRQATASSLVARRFASCCALLGALIATSSRPAIADKAYPVAILAFSGSPVTLNKCEAWARDANKTYLYTHVSVQNYFFDLGIAFTNTSAKPITAVRVQMISYDSFNTSLRSADFDTQENRSADKMSVAPGASADMLGPKSWHRLNGVPNRDHVSCAVTAVRFADGTTWNAGSSTPTQAVTTPAPTGHNPLTGPVAPSVSPSP